MFAFDPAPLSNIGIEDEGPRKKQSPAFFEPGL